MQLPFVRPTSPFLKRFVVGSVLRGLVASSRGVSTAYPSTCDLAKVTEANQAIVEVGATILGQLKRLWIVAGDLNISPEELAATCWPDVVDGVDLGGQRRQLENKQTRTATKGEG